MRFSIGSDVAKEVHWVCVMNDLGEIVLNRALRNEPREVAKLVAELEKRVFNLL